MIITKQMRIVGVNVRAERKNNVLCQGNLLSERIYAPRVNPFKVTLLQTHTERNIRQRYVTTLNRIEIRPGEAATRVVAGLKRLNQRQVTGVVLFRIK